MRGERGVFAHRRTRALRAHLGVLRSEPLSLNRVDRGELQDRFGRNLAHNSADVEVKYTVFSGVHSREEAASPEWKLLLHRPTVSRPKRPHLETANMLRSCI